MTKNIAISILLLISFSCSPKIEEDKYQNKKPKKDLFQELSQTSEGIYPI